LIYYYVQVSLYDIDTCRYTSTPLHTVCAINIVQTPNFDSADLHNCNTFEYELTQETGTIEFSNQVPHVLTTEFENDTNKFEKFWQNKNKAKHFEILQFICTFRKTILTGRRIIVRYLSHFKQIQNNLHEDRFGCSFAIMEFI